jgi:arylsulfate sulfotransferase
MKLFFAPKPTFVAVVSIACALMAACGAGSNIPPAPIVSVSSTQNPLVAQYSVAMPCSGQAMVEFGPDTSYGRTTPWYPVSPNYVQTPIVVAGMKASTTYHMRAQTQCAGNTSTSGDLTFKTGPLPSLPFPKMTVTRPNPPLSSSENPGIELVDLIPLSGPPTMLGFFVDRDANPIWYYDVGAGNYPFTIKFLPNGHLIFSITEPTLTLIREVDLAGNTIREMDTSTLQEKMRNGGYDFVPGNFHHDVLPLANGHLIVLVGISKIFTNLPGYPGTMAVGGDALVDLDPNWNPVWAWNSFDYLDVNRHLNGLPDWTHSNTLVYSPDDGNILLSMRNQSWILKIDYNNGAGSGNVLWKLGYQGDFALTDAGIPTNDPSEWFSAQHFPSLISQNGSQTTLAIWDNGDNRVLSDAGQICIAVGGTPCYSRATIFQVDESAMVANLQWADPQQLFGIWGGSINQLGNGNVEFDLNDPAIPPSPNLASQIQEVTQTSTPQLVWEMDISLPTNAYRGYRVPSLYPGVSWPF